ncbi:recombination-associated protein RdgC [Candidatus Photodesmus anomalopis]|uniref:Recombination-associated protein RdgC n=1 Tax=Candidatus Photodesmus katoptron Akat1 TaxID=1236703 RepID=S3DHL8_9GAMM|nr:recombination-associated protein RdgC [Candidatus Photodesmus katoptron]EPE37180.1 recombination-associated protein RdgC [Candidatus Photodesmus katoptron Akat1]
MNLFPKNLIIYDIINELNLFKSESLNNLNNLLKENQFKPCGRTDKIKIGFIQPIEKTFIHSFSDNLMFRALKQTKSISYSAFKKQFSEKIKKSEERKQRSLNKKELKNLKEDLIIDLLPYTLPVDKFTNMFTFHSNKYLLIESANYNSAEEYTNLLRKAIGSLPIQPIKSSYKKIETIMTEWVKTGDLPDCFSLGTSAVLKSQTDGALIQCKNQELTSDEVLKHIELNKMVTQLTINWKEKISFNIKNDFSLTRIKFSNELKETNNDIFCEDKISRFYADYSLITGEINSLLSDLNKYLIFNG